MSDVEVRRKNTTGQVEPVTVEPITNGEVQLLLTQLRLIEGEKVSGDDMVFINDGHEQGLRIVLAAMGITDPKSPDLSGIESLDPSSVITEISRKREEITEEVLQSRYPNAGKLNSTLFQLESFLRLHGGLTD